MDLCGIWRVIIKNLKIGPFLYILVLVTVVILFVVALVQGFDPRNLLDYLRLVSTVVTVDGILCFVFATWIWRWKILQGLLIPFPDLNGTWHGYIQTHWNDIESNMPESIPVVLTIKQSFWGMSCVMRTDEMESHSYLEGFCIDKDAQVRRLCYSYTSKPKIALRERSTPHDGTMLFNIIGRPVSKLEGEYWTQRKTTGTVELTFLTKKLLEEVPREFRRIR